MKGGGLITSSRKMRDYSKIEKKSFRKKISRREGSLPLNVSGKRERRTKDRSRNTARKGHLFCQKETQVRGEKPYRLEKRRGSHINTKKGRLAPLFRGGGGKNRRGGLLGKKAALLRENNVGKEGKA